MGSVRVSHWIGVTFLAEAFVYSSIELGRRVLVVLSTMMSAWSVEAIGLIMVYPQVRNPVASHQFSERLASTWS
jgi:hypothetical protein